MWTLFVALNHHPLFSTESQPADSKYALHSWQPTTFKTHLSGFALGGRPSKIPRQGAAVKLVIVDTKAAPAVKRFCDRIY